MEWISKRFLQSMYGLAALIILKSLSLYDFYVGTALLLHTLVMIALWFIDGNIPDGPKRKLVNYFQFMLSFPIDNATAIGVIIVVYQALILEKTTIDIYFIFMSCWACGLIALICLAAYWWRQPLHYIRQIRGKMPLN